MWLTGLLWRFLVVYKPPTSLYITCMNASNFGNRIPDIHRLPKYSWTWRYKLSIHLQSSLPGFSLLRQLLLESRAGGTQQQQQTLINRVNHTCLGLQSWIVSIWWVFSWWVKTYNLVGAHFWVSGYDTRISNNSVLKLLWEQRKDHHYHCHS